MSDMRENPATQPKSVIRAVGYTRVSTGGQAVDGFSLGSQERVIRGEVGRRGWVLGEVVVEAASGRSAGNRGELQRVVGVLAAGGADVLVVARLDRLARSLIDLLTLMDRAEREGWALLILSPMVDMSDPFGRCMAQMAGAFAELESKLIGARQRESVAARRLAGTWRPTPKQVSDEVEDRIRHLASEGFGARRIARQLELEGYKPPRASSWQPSTVQVALRRLRASEAA